MFGIAEYHRMNERHKKLSRQPRKFLFVASCGDRKITVEGETREEGREAIEAIRKQYFPDYRREDWTVTAFMRAAI